MWVIPRIGGGIGNRLFEFAAAAGAAEIWGRPVAFSTEFIEPNTHASPVSILRLFPDVPVVHIADEDADSVHYENDEVYTYRPFPDPPSERPVIMKGFFQSPFYFPKAGIKPVWTALVDTAAVAKAAALETEVERRKTWFIHFRFGDYKGNAFHYWDLTKYYIKCLMEVPLGARLHVFSDEPELCREWLLEALAVMKRDEDITITWSVSKKDVDALYEMSLCWGGAIIANSTFSWWGAYFAHEAAGSASAHRAFYPDGWGLGVPPPTDLVPAWGEMVATEWSPDPL